MSEPTAPAAAPTVPRREVLVLVLCSLFVGFFVAAEVLGNKVFRFTLLGIGPRSLGLLDEDHFAATTGIFAFPLTFVLTDIANEYYGKRVVRLFTWLAIATNLLLQPVIQLAVRAPAKSYTAGVTAEQVDSAFQIALGQTWSIVVASLIAFAVGQWLDVQVFTVLRRATGGKWLWLRSQGSTVVSQLADTIAVIFLAFVVIPKLVGGNAWSVGQASEVALTNYVYKFAIAVGITPVLYFVHAAVERYLGREEAQALVHIAHPRDPD